MNTELKIIVADDHPLFRGALIEALNGIENTKTIIETGDFDATKKAVSEHPDADLLLLDLSMPGVTGLSGIVTIQALQQSLPVAVVSATDDAVTVNRAIELGASGFISKSSTLEDIRTAIRSVLDGDVHIPAGAVLGQDSDPEVAEMISSIRALTPQQARVLGMLAEGLLNKQIAYELGVSEATVKAHVSAVLQKLGVDSRTQAVIKLSKIGADQIKPPA